jgi:tRNA(Ile)-lysidine synthetase-like protein
MDRQKAKVLAISGGVDSVVMLDRLALAGGNLVVAHFNHGIRDDSDEDEKLVGELAAKYGLEYEHLKESLGPKASEDLARRRRYLFLRQVAQKHAGVIYTAHHADDVIESIAINLIRGTGWRGLVPLDSPDIVRPMLEYFKSDNLKYAEEHQLVWREDSTNQSSDYLRNRVRRALQVLTLGEKRDLLALYAKQKQLKKSIDSLTKRAFRADKTYNRRFYNKLDEAVALEVLRRVLEHAGHLTTIPQRREFLRAIKTYQSGKKFNLPAGQMAKFTKDDFKL